MDTEDQVMSFTGPPVGGSCTVDLLKRTPRNTREKWHLVVNMFEKHTFVFRPLRHGLLPVIQVVFARLHFLLT